LRNQNFQLVKRKRKLRKKIKKAQAQIAQEKNKIDKAQAQITQLFSKI